MDGPSSSVTPQLDSERLFAEKKRKFEDADKSFRDLVDSLTEYKAAMLREAECGVAVATKIQKFFALQDRPHKQVAVKFLEARETIRSKWVSDAENSFDADVLAPIKSRLKEIPDVRSYIKNRSNALAEMQRRQKKLQANRKREGAHFRDRQRKCREMSEQYSFHNDQVIKRFSYLERNMGNFVTAPLRSLISIMSDVSQAAVESLSLVLTMVAETPPITKDLSPNPAMLMNDINGGVVGVEKWDDSFEENNSNNNTTAKHSDKSNTTGTDDRLPPAQQFPSNFDIDSRTSPVTDLHQMSYTQIQYPLSTSHAQNNSGLRSHSRVRSAEAGPGTSMDNSPFADLSHIASPRRGRSASSAPGDTSASTSASMMIGTILPVYSSSIAESTLKNPSGQFSSHAQHPSGAASSSGRGSHPSMTASLAINSVASSSTSTDNAAVDRDRIATPHVSNPQPSTYFHHLATAPSATAAARLRRRQCGHYGSVDTVPSSESISGHGHINNNLQQPLHPDRISSMDGGRPASTTTTTNITNSSSAHNNSNHKAFIGRLVALYQFTPREENELALNVGNVVEVISRNDSGWWTGQIDKACGFFPYNYTRPLSEKEELEYLAETEKERRRKRIGHRRHASADAKLSQASQGHQQQQQTQTPTPLPAQSSVTAN